MSFSIKFSMTGPGYRIVHTYAHDRNGELIEVTDYWKSGYGYARWYDHLTVKQCEDRADGRVGW